MQCSRHDHHRNSRIIAHFPEWLCLPWSKAVFGHPLAGASGVYKSKILTVVSRSKWRSPSQHQSSSGVWIHRIFTRHEKDSLCLLCRYQHEIRNCFCEVAQVTSHNKADRKNSQTYIPVRASPIPGLTYAYIENITAQGGSCNVTYRRLLRTS